MFKAVGEIVAGVGVVALDIVAPFVGLELTPSMMAGIAGSGSSMVMGGIGTLLTKQMQGLSSSVRNPIQPQNVLYGRAASRSALELLV